MAYEAHPCNALTGWKLPILEDQWGWYIYLPAPSSSGAGRNPKGWCFSAPQTLSMKRTPWKIQVHLVDFLMVN